MRRLTFIELLIHYYYYRELLYPDEIATLLDCSTFAVVRMLERIERKLAPVACTESGVERETRRAA